MHSKWNKINKFIVALLSALLLLLLWGTAVAQQNSIKNTDLVKFGSDITVTESQVVKNATATSLRGYRCLYLV